MQLQKRRLQGDPNHPRATKTEAAYFIAEGGRRTGILILNMNDASELPRIAEPWFLALNASIEEGSSRCPRSPDMWYEDAVRRPAAAGARGH